MEPLQIRGELLHVDVRGELEQFDWHRPTWRGDKLIAASPFRPDNTPSFFVRLTAQDGYDAGLWTDSGSHDGANEKGGFVQLLAYLRRESWDDTEDYLFSKYGTGRKRAEKLTIPNLARRKQYKRLPLEKSIAAMTSNYLLKRGISEEAQREARTGKPLLIGASGYTALGWFNVLGELCNIKYRSTTGKRFFYERDGQPISELVFGADLYVKYMGDLILCEAEIDALSWRTAGVPAVAVGGSSLNKKQADIIARLPCAAVVIAGDNDEAGAKLARKASELLRGKILKRIQYGALTENDANDILINHGAEQLATLFHTSKRIPITVHREHI